MLSVLYLFSICLLLLLFLLSRWARGRDMESGLGQMNYGSELVEVVSFSKAVI